MVIPVVRSTEAACPQGLTRESSFYKLYIPDGGLLLFAFPVRMWRGF